MPLPLPVLPLSETALIDEAAAALGHDVADLMERAGAAMAREAARMAPAGWILVMCGAGNNGGDGYVCARLLADAGRTVRVWAVAEPGSALCRANARRLPDTCMRLSAPPADAPALVIDAILGAGMRGRPREPVASALAWLKASGRTILAADVPSGLGSELMARTALTLCFQAAKQELLGAPGVDEFKTVDLGIPPAAWLEVQPSCMRRFPPLKRNGHKGSHGELLVIGGGIFPGALELACRAAITTGCDMVRAWTAEGPPLPPTIVAHRQHGAYLGSADPEELTPLLVRASALLIGPGLGREPATRAATEQAFELAIEVGVPVVVDADAITHLNDALRDRSVGDTPILVTPHRGEARTLLGGPVDDERLHAWARRDRVLLAKAPVDLISDGWRWQRNPRGNPRMAVGGTGDCLAGLAGGLIARGASPFDAARMAVLWLTTCADELWLEQGPCYDALDLIERLPTTLRSLMQPLGLWPPIVD
ncbi:MAG TPA: NAD(P)H-hydrate dehydratase [Planctomycetota bacterium]|nr:NAD(P)H-hydrate dehydratase [Planctomycetota bacterium]